MHVEDHTLALRRDLLAGNRMLFAGTESEVATAAVGRCGGLGADVDVLSTEDPLDEVAVGGAVDALTAMPATLVVDAAGRFAVTAATPGADTGLDALRAAGDSAWIVIHAVATRWFIPSGGGKIVLLAPAPSAGPHAGATRVAVENLARALSIEWARFQIRPTAILPGAGTTPAEVASLIAYLGSPAGDYFSGCAFTLGAVPAAG